MDQEAAKWLASFKLKGIGIDTISMDDMNSTDFSVHKEFLTKNIFIIENLTNLDAVCKEHFTLCVMPIKTTKTDGSPVRAVAIEDLR